MQNYVVEISTGKTFYSLSLGMMAKYPDMKGHIFVPEENFKEATKIMEGRNVTVSTDKIQPRVIDSIVNHLVAEGNRVHTVYVSGNRAEELVTRFSDWNKAGNVVAVVESRGKLLKSYLNALLRHSKGRFEVFEVS